MKTKIKKLDWRTKTILTCVFLFLTNVVQGQTINSIEEVRSTSKSFDQLLFNNTTIYFLSGEREQKKGEDAIAVIDLDLKHAVPPTVLKEAIGTWNFEKTKLVVIRNVSQANLLTVKENLLDKLPSLEYVYLILGIGDLGSWLTEVKGLPDNPWHYVYTRQVDSE
ncbi:hypothetical protein [Sphingobacterium faecale]|uniref:DUF4347 domain-containing protein n=1 Tax=Sphingobacterium faecale TaxID=2803775 RepID=A0ABS1RAB1_9SPHI|nr:hypothetical protein [Sphingobacterium faecale]MBL1410962.1 hypothetical protein [Sphingobacterium faecale]